MEYHKSYKKMIGKGENLMEPDLMSKPDEAELP